ncbi:MAG: DUF1501 domain-containing protein [Candidatus Kapabacteria bacterium]|nr:DUF1501 domain-containing protein [Candidatus Kapabacteria bacterium]
MKRREFMSKSGKAVALTTVAAGLGGMRIDALAASPVMNRMNQLAGDNDRVFVLVQLTGGNDGLNTIIPIDNADYYKARPTIAIQKKDTLALRNGLGWHPALSGFKSMYDKGTLSVVQGVTYPNPDRSHFRGTDIWLTATDTDVFKDTGWVGRYLQTLAPNFPTTMPEHPLAVQIGTSLTLGFKAPGGSIGITFRDPDAFYSLVEQNGNSAYDAAPKTYGGDELDFMRSVERSSQLYSKAVKAAADKVKQNKVTYPTGLGQSLRIVARLIAGGLKTKFYLVNIQGNSFDTHIDQGGATGAHASLLQQVSDGVKAFMDDCDQLGIGDRVAGMTFSEFGRRVMENGSRGTDHGTAAPLFVFGKNVIGNQVHGADPNLTSLDNRGDLLMDFDYRQVYAAALMQWFGAAQTDLQQALLRDFAPLPLFNQLSSAGDEESAQLLASMRTYPNPSSDVAVISYSLPSAADVRVTMHDIRGSVIGVPFSGQQQEGAQTVSANVATLPAGTYFFTINAGRLKQMKAFTVMR